jgi:hypothetical protein
MKRAKIILDSMQLKSLRSARKLAKALTIIEEECGIKQVRLILKDCFLCGWTDFEKLDRTPMERLIRDIIRKF